MCCYKLYLMLVAHCKAKLFPCGNTCPKRYNCIRNNFGVYFMHRMCAQCTTYTASIPSLVYLFFNISISQMCQNPVEKVKFSSFTQKILNFPLPSVEMKYSDFYLFIFFFLWLKFRDYAEMRKVQFDFVWYMHDCLDSSSDFICFVSFWRHLDANRSRSNSSHFTHSNIFYIILNWIELNQVRKCSRKYFHYDPSYKTSLFIQFRKNDHLFGELFVHCERFTNLK